MNRLMILVAALVVTFTILYVGHSQTKCAVCGQASTFSVDGEPCCESMACVAKIMNDHR